MRNSVKEYCTKTKISVLIQESTFLMENYVCFLFQNCNGWREKSTFLLLNTRIVLMWEPYRVLFCRRAWATVLGIICTRRNSNNFRTKATCCTAISSGFLIPLLNSLRAIGDKDWLLALLPCVLLKVSSMWIFVWVALSYETLRSCMS
jgi:hypothetical protein